MRWWWLWWDLSVLKIKHIGQMRDIQGLHGNKIHTDPENNNDKDSVYLLGYRKTWMGALNTLPLIEPLLVSVSLISSRFGTNR